MPSGIFKPAFAVVLPTTVDQKASAPASHPLLVSQDSHIFIDETSLQISKVGQKSLTLPKASADWIVNVTLSVRSSVAAQAPTISISIPSLKLDLRPVRVGKPIPADTTSSTFISAAFRIQLWPSSLDTHAFSPPCSLRYSVWAPFTSCSHPWTPSHNPPSSNHYDRTRSNQLLLKRKRGIAMHFRTERT